MSGCLECGQPTPKARCKLCRVEHTAATDHEFYECPDCGGVTSGEDVTCADCRRVQQVVGTRDGDK